ncbi:hypothetical protein [Streptomyces mayteni]
MTPLPTPVHDVHICVRYLGACGGPFAHLIMDFEPPRADDVLELVSAVPEERLPGEFLPPLRAGLLDGLGEVTAAALIKDSAFHETDSSERGYRIAGIQAGRAARIAAGLLPPEEAGNLRFATWPGQPSFEEKRHRRRGLPA